MNLMLQAQRFTELAQRHFGRRLIAVVLFGSVARGTAREDSDIDLLVVIDGLPKGRYVRRMVLEPIFEILAKEGCATPINCHLKTSEEAVRPIVLYYDLSHDAKVLFDTDGFFQQVLTRVTDHIERSGAVRKRVGHFYYWDLHPNGRVGDTFEII